MYVCVTLAVLPVIANYIVCDSTTNIPKDVQQKYKLKSLLKDLSSTTNALQVNPSMQSSLTLHTTTDHNKPRMPLEETYPQYVLTSPHLTKLAKTLSLSFDPSFSKDYFEPFERRPRPVTLVAFRKNGLDPKHVIKHDGCKLSSSEVAELQSPYNDVGTFWQDEPEGRTN